MLDVRVAQTTLENTLKDTVLFALRHRLPAVATVAALRAFPTAGATGTMRDDDELINVVVGGVVSAAYRWNTTSLAADDGASVVKPTDVTGAGRWLRWTSALRLAPVVGGPSYYLHELLDGPLERVIVLDKAADKNEMTELLNSNPPAVAIDSHGDDPDDYTQVTGHRYNTRFQFTVYVVSENLRDQRQAAQGSAISGDTALGANSIDGLIWSLLGGTQLHAVVDGIRNIEVGHGGNWVSELAQRRVIRSREYDVLATVENPPASNDAGAAQEVDTQQRMTDLGTNDAFDATNYIVDGIDVSVGAGFVRTVRAGTATIAGNTVAFAGELKNFAANSDIYRDLLPNGTMTYVVVGLEQEEPAVTATALRIGKTRTDGSGVVDDAITAERRQAYMNPRQTPLT